MTRAMLCDVIRRRSHRGASHDVLAVFGHVQKPGFDVRACIVSYIILSRNVLRYRLTSCDVADLCTVFYIHVLTCTTFSRCCAMVRDRATIVNFIIVQMLISASRQTIIIKSYDLIRLSYDGRTMSYYFHKIIYVP